MYLYVLCLFVIAGQSLSLPPPSKGKIVRREDTLDACSDRQKCAEVEGKTNVMKILCQCAEDKICGNCIKFDIPDTEDYAECFCQDKEEDE